MKDVYISVDAYIMKMQIMYYPLAENADPLQEHMLSSSVQCGKHVVHLHKSGENPPKVNMATWQRSIKK